MSLTRPRVVMIAAVARNGVIGKEGRLPWHIKEELQHFKKTTANTPLIMGSSTHKSMPTSVWVDRQPFVLTRMPDELEAKYPGVIAGRSLSKLISMASATTKTNQVFLIGGAFVFELGYSCADEIIISRLHEAYEGDTSMPPIPSNFHRTMTDLRHTSFVVEHFLREP